MGKPDIKTILIPDGGLFPNNDALPLIIMRQVFDHATENLAQTIENTFHENAWGRSWRNGIYDFHHYHSTAHEVLGVYSGSAEVQLGGNNGITLTVHGGDVVIIPAGVAHKNLGASADFRVVGAYPSGTRPDMCYGKAGERPQADDRIAKLSLPDLDPVYGAEGPLTEFWKISG